MRNKHRDRGCGRISSRGKPLGLEYVRVSDLFFPMTRNKDADSIPAVIHHQIPVYITAESSTEQISPLHSMTSSARASNKGGTVRLSAFAVLRFTISSNLRGA